MWLKGKPAKSPPMPPHVPLEHLMGAVAALESKGMATPAMTYIRAHGPKLELDKWGEALPLSPVDQDRLDRLFAILADPVGRGRALLVSGLLGPDEVEALQGAAPEAWSQLANQAYREMMIDHPPYPAWVEATLGVLFGQDAAKIYTEGPPQEAAPRGTPAGGDPGALPTMADRREIGVREQRRSG